MDAWIRPALLCVSLLSVSAARPEASARPDGGVVPVAAGAEESSAETATPRTAGFDGAFVAADRTAGRTSSKRTAARASRGKRYATRNFVVTAPSLEFAKEVAFAAESCRETLALKWLGETLPDWERKCPVDTMKVGPHIGAGGATSFGFHRDARGWHAGGWRMNVQGSRERILDSVIPHEVNHTVFATHFRRPLPRWADEGAATLTEHPSEKLRQRKTLGQVWRTHRMPLTTLLPMMDYPGDPQRPTPGDGDKVLTLYAQGYSLADYLVRRGGTARFVKFLGQATRHINPGDQDHPWDRRVATADLTAALREHYDVSDFRSLESTWSEWVVAGSPRLSTPAGAKLAKADTRAAEPRRRGASSATIAAAPPTAPPAGVRTASLADTPPARTAARETLAEAAPVRRPSADRPSADRRPADRRPAARQPAPGRVRIRAQNAGRTDADRPGTRRPAATRTVPLPRTVEPPAATPSPFARTEPPTNAGAAPTPSRRARPKPLNARVTYEELVGRG